MNRERADQVIADDEGLRVDVDPDSVLDLFFDGRRIWSVTATKGRRDLRGHLHVAWPERMKRRLDGYGFLEVKLNSSGELVAAGDVSFGSGEQALDFTDAQGRPLTLDKWGRWNHTFDSTPREVKEGYLDQVQEVLTLLKEECGLDAFMSFGTLLGAVREGGLIGHDVDVDLGYISHYDHPVDVARESLRIERVVRGHGYRLQRNHGGFLAIFLKQSDGASRNLDIFTAFFVEGMLYQVNDVGVRAEWSDVLPLQMIDFEGRPMPAPARPEVFLESAYGPGWKVPDPGFSFDTAKSTKRRISGWLGGLRVERDTWARYYDGPGAREPESGSEFARWVAGREPGAKVIDVGCGIGDDSTYFAGLGQQVLGLDFVGVAVRQARRRAADQPGETEFVNLNLYSVADSLRMGAELSRREAPHIVFARGLLDVMRPDGRDSFWRLCSMVLRGGQRCYLEVGGAMTGPDLPPRMRPGVSDLVREAKEHGARLIHKEALPPGGADKGGRVTRLVLEW